MWRGLTLLVQGPSDPVSVGMEEAPKRTESVGFAQKKTASSAVFILPVRLSARDLSRPSACLSGRPAVRLSSRHPFLLTSHPLSAHCIVCPYPAVLWLWVHEGVTVPTGPHVCSGTNSVLPPVLLPSSSPLPPATPDISEEEGMGGRLGPGWGCV